MLLKPTRWRHGDVALMCLSTAQIGYSWIALPRVRVALWERGWAVGWSSICPSKCTASKHVITPPHPPALLQTLPPSFVRFLDKHGGKPPHV